MLSIWSLSIIEFDIGIFFPRAILKATFHLGIQNQCNIVLTRHMFNKCQHKSNKEA